MMTTELFRTRKIPMPWLRSLRSVSMLVLGGLLAANARADALEDPTYTALRAARPDGRTISVSSLALDRDVFHFDFASGAFHLLAPVEGRTVGAVFLGQRSLRRTPATPGERLRVAMASGADPKGLETLTDTFTRLVLFFGDDTAAELALSAPVREGAPDPKALAAWDDHL